MYLTPHFSDYRVDESVEFNKEISSVFEEGYSETLMVKTQHDKFLAELETLKDVYKKSRKSVLTLKIEDTDNSRDKSINGITAIAKAYLNHYDPQIVDAAFLLLKEIEKYGSKIADKNYQAETAVLDDLISMYKDDTKLNAAVNLLHLGEWFNKTETINNEFKTLISKRDIEITDRPKGKTKDSIAACIEKFNELILHLTAYSITQPSELHNTVRDRINQIIDKYNTIQRRNKK